MGTYSFYIPKDKEKAIVRQLDKIAKNKGTSKSDLMTDIILDYVSRVQVGEGQSPGWASNFCGVWKGEKDSEKIIRIIEKKRSRRKTSVLK